MPRLLFLDTSPPLPPGTQQDATLSRVLQGKVGPATRFEARAERAGGGYAGSGGKGSGSLVNAVEAEAVGVLVGEMLAPPHAVHPRDIAVICLYRAQVARVREVLLGAPGGSVGGGGGYTSRHSGCMSGE